MNRVVPRALAVGSVLIVVAGCVTSGRAARPQRPAGQAASAAVAATTLRTGRWSALPRAPISPRDGASAVWTGRELLVWGGESGTDGEDLHADGAAYDPGTGRWRTLPPSPLSARAGQAASWTGTEMIIWGGYDRVSAHRFAVTSSGAAYDPATSTWRRLPPAPLSPRAGAIAVWTGSALILLGGQPAALTGTVHSYGDGASFNPALNRWQHIAPPAPPNGHPLTWRAAVNASTELLAWSEWAQSRRTGPDTGTDSGGVDLFAYREDTGQWRLVPPAAGMLPDAEEVLWTGQFALVRGITYNCGVCPGPFVPEATDLYNPLRNTWTRLPPDPLGGSNLVAARTGTALFSFNPGGQFGRVRPGDASVYDAKLRRWSRLPAAPFGCDTQDSPAWTGMQLLLYCPRPPGGPGAGHDGLGFKVRP